MRKLLIAFILIVIGVLTGYFIHLDAGYIAIYYSGVSIETSLWIGLIILILAFILLHFLIRLISHLTHLKQYLKNWSTSRSASKHQQLTSQGIHQYVQKDWKHAEKSLAKAADLSQAPLENYLNAAKAAQHLGAYDRRDDHLQAAYEQVVVSRPVILITQANLQIEAQQFEQAIATLLNLLQKNPQYKPALSSLHTVYKKIGDWKALHDLLPSLKKYKAIQQHEINTIEEDIALLELTKAAKLPTIIGIQSLWNMLSKSIQTRPRVIECYIKALIHFNDHQNAQTWIEKTLAKKWIPALVSLYALIKADNQAKLLATAEKWLRQHPKDKILLLALAKMAFNASFYLKASDYTHQLLSLEPSKAAWNLLGDIHEAQQQLSEAIVCYKKAIRAG